MTRFAPYRWSWICLALLALSLPAGKTVLRRTARSVTATRSSAGALGIRVLVPAGAVRAGGEYSFVVEAADRRDRTAELWVTLVTR